MTPDVVSAFLGGAGVLMFVVWLVSYVQERRRVAEHAAIQPVATPSPAKPAPVQRVATPSVAQPTPAQRVATPSVATPSSASTAETVAPPPSTAKETPAAVAAAEPIEVFDNAAPSEDEATLLYRGSGAATIKPPPFEERGSDGLLPAASSRPPPPGGSCSRVKVSYEEDAEEEENTSPLARILVYAKGDSDTGKVRRANEDTLLFLPERSLFGVADGMGGYTGGKVASSLAVQCVRHAFERDSFDAPLRSAVPLPRRGRELASAILESSQAVREAASHSPELAKMGTTLLAVRFSPNKQRVYVAHVGDSRCYRLRGGSLRQLTTDHTMREVGLKGRGADHLFQAVGVTPQLSIDLIVDKPRAGDIYLMCTDGLSKMVPDSQIIDILSEQTDLEMAVYGLIERANDNGGRDNVSVVLVKVVDKPVQDLLPDRQISGWGRVPQQRKAPARAPERSPTDDEATVIGKVELDEATTLVRKPRAKARQ